LDWVIDNETLVILTKDKANQCCVTRVYPARDLVQLPSTNDPGEDSASLIDLITSTIATQSWNDVGGPGTAHYFTSVGTLVVTQTRDVHDQIERLLVTLREARDEQGARRMSPSVVTASIPRTHPPLPSPARQYAAAQPWNQPQIHQ
jgi:hypothetical protein